MKGMRAADWILLGFALLGMLGLASETASLRTFAKMFEDFGGTLPLATQFVISTWLPVDLLVLVAVLAGTGVILRVKSIAEGVGRALLVVAVLASCIGVPLIMAAMYLPVISLAGAIN